jgi:hypothetical protein
VNNTRILRIKFMNYTAKYDSVYLEYSKSVSLLPGEAGTASASS